MRTLKSFCLGLVLLTGWASGGLSAQTTTVTFESLPLPSSGFFNGDTDASSPFRDNFMNTGTRDSFGQTEYLQLWKIDGVEFFNSYTPAFGSWSGFSWSNVADSTTAGFGNQYASFPGGGSDGAGGSTAGQNYAIGFGNSSYFNLPNQVELESIELTNASYAGISMRDGDAFAKKFGGTSGNDLDYFSIRFAGFDDIDLSGNQIGSLEFFLADYRFADNSQDYILDTWENFDLSAIGAARSVGITFTTTDIGDFGANTPAFVAIDNLTFSVTPVPEPGNLLLYLLASAGVLARRRTPN